MARLVAVVLAGVLVGGCATYGTSKGVAQTGGALILGTLVIGTSVASNDDSVDAGDAAAIMVPLVLIGGLMVLAGLAGMASNSQASQTPAFVQPPMMVDPMAADADRRRRAAWDMTQQARVAAYASDCARVAYLAQRVVELDRATFDTVFSRDPYIVKCAPKPPPDPPRSIPIPPLDPVPANPPPDP